MDTYPEVEWARFERAFKWLQGEHLLVVAATGQGKTTLLSRVLPKRTYQVVFVTKVHDETFDKEYTARGYTRIESWPPPRHLNKVLLWPRFPKGTKLKDIAKKQKEVFDDALNAIFHERGWTVVFDEEHYMSTFLGLADLIAMYHHQARSSKLTVVDGIQRPAFVPVITYSSASHAFIGKFSEKADLTRLSGLAGLDSKTLAQNMMSLGDKEWVYVDTRRMGNVPVRTKVRL